MFSVGASPFNSPANSLYGGWAQSPQANQMDITGLNDFYSQPANAQTMYGDSKWANIIMRFSRDAQKRLIAKKIKAATKNMLKAWRQNETWRKNYNLALAGMRSPYRRKPLDIDKRAAIVANFEAMKAPFSSGELTWLSALARAPFVANPGLPGVTPEGNNMLWSGADYMPSLITDTAARAVQLDPYLARRTYLLGKLPAEARAAFADDSNATIEKALTQQGIEY